MLTSFTYVLEETFLFREIDDRDLYRSCETLTVAHSKAKPLQLTTPVGIVAHPDVKFSVTDMTYLVTVCTLKICVKLHQF